MIDRSAVGDELPPVTLPVEAGRLRFFAKAIGETNPIYLDNQAAQDVGYRALPAPPTFLMAVGLEPPEPYGYLADLGVELSTVLHGTQAFRYLGDVCAGDVLTQRSRIVDIYDRRGGELEFVVQEGVVTNQFGMPVAEVSGTVVVRSPDAARRTTEPAASGPVSPGATTPEARTPGATGARPVATAVVAGEGAEDLAGDPATDLAGELSVLPISRTTLALFAGASGDHNPVHIDRDAAHAAGYADVFAHGMLSMAYLGRLLTDHVPARRLREFSVRFVAVTPVNVALRCRSTVSRSVSVDGQRAAVLDLEVALPDGTVTVRGSAVVLLS